MPTDLLTSRNSHNHRALRMAHTTYKTTIVDCVLSLG